MTDRQRKVDAFRLMYAAVSLPFGGALGVMLTNLGAHQARVALAIGDVVLLGLGLTCLGLFFVAMPIVCEAVIRDRVRMSFPNVTVTAAAAFLCVVRMPVEVLGIDFRLWVAVIGAWIACCLVLCWLCRTADIKKSIFR